MLHKDKPITKLWYSIGEVSKAASCETVWVHWLVKTFKLRIKKNSRGHLIFTEQQKDDIVRLRWLYTDYQKCVKYCFENKIMIK